MGSNEHLPLGPVENKAFKVFMRLYVKAHLDETEDECNWNGRNAWEKLNLKQKQLFSVPPRGYIASLRAPIPKKKPQALRKRTAVRRPAHRCGKKRPQAMRKRAVGRPECRSGKKKGKLAKPKKTVCRQNRKTVRKSCRR